MPVTRLNRHSATLIGMVVRPQKQQRWFIREWRDHRELTLQQVASELETSVSMISELERGIRRMNDGWVDKLSRIFRVEPNDLLRPPGESPHELEAIWSLASEDDRRKILDMARIITGQAAKTP